MAKRLLGEEPIVLPKTSMMGALSYYISDPSVENFQPMGSNMGILPDIGVRIRDKSERYLYIAERGLNDLKEAMKG